ncbi:phosphoenolpyruvate synthase, partial [Candidatus Micrarchaeota archaeon]|nr:phosphoenolpyruvate synthase [Candidatus Micrarchaeota archaeon]
MKAVYWLNELNKDSLKIAGGKGANLAELFNLNLPVPPAFVVCADAYFEFIRKNKIDELIIRKTDRLDMQDSNALQRASDEIKAAIIAGQISEDVRSQIIRAYNKLCGVDLIPSIGEEVFVAVRSSATAEDLPKFSFAGQQATLLNIAGGEKVVKAVRKCWASLFEGRAIYYRKQQGFSQVETGIAVIVEKMVDSDKAGVTFTVDPMSGDENKIVIEVGLGLGESVVSGSITPDRYTIDKASLQILDKKIARQKDMIVRKTGGETQHVEVPEELQEAQKLSDNEIRSLSKFARRIEEHYSWPQDIEWAIEGKTVYIVQTRAVTTLKRKRGEPIAPSPQPFELAAALPSPEAFATAATPASSAVASLENARVLLQGFGASPGVASGTVKIVLNLRELNKVRDGDVLVTEMTSPDFVPAMKRAKAIVTDSGGMTCHAAIVSRELGVPCIVGTQQATSVLQDGQAITVDAKRGVVYEGIVAFEEEKPVEKKVAEHVALVTPIVTGTKVYVNLAEPDQAEAVAKQNVDGVGLLRAEFMIAGFGVHPKKLIAEGREQEFIDGIARGLRKICAPFHPRPVIYRATDFKTNEYRGLQGGEEFEPKEENPLIGFRGCYRYVKQPDVFRLELRALKKVRDQYGMKNLWLMIP